MSRQQKSGKNVVLTRFPDYFIYESSLIRNRYTNRAVKKYTDRGYIKCRLKNSKGKLEVISIHKLLALAFIENPNNCFAVDHKDGNVSNNELSNLRWISLVEEEHDTTDEDLEIRKERKEM